MALSHVACQTYICEMLGEEWTTSVDEILDVIAIERGYQHENLMLRSMKRALRRFTSFIEV